MTIPTGESDDAFRAPARSPAAPAPRGPIAQQEVDENGYSYPEPPKELQLTIERRRPRPSPTTTPRPQPTTTTTPFAEAPLPIYGAPSQPFRAGRSQPAFRAGFGTRNRSGRIVKVLRRRKRKLNKDSANKLERDPKKSEDVEVGDHEVVSAAAKFAQAVDVVTLNLREENESNSVEEEGREE